MSFTTELAPAIQQSLVCFIAVGTPQDRDGSADLSMVLKVARDIGRQMNGYKVIVEKSTVPVGTARQVRQVIQEEFAARGESFEFDVVSNPEFLKEGTALDDFMKPDRIVVGCDDVRVAALMKELYAPFVRTNHPIIIMDVVSSELTKYAANAFLAAKISFINELANICSRTGADISMIRQGIGSDRRIGPLFLFPGLGYGGSCISQRYASPDPYRQILGFTPPAAGSGGSHQPGSAPDLRGLDQQVLPGKSPGAGFRAMKAVFQATNR